MVVRNLTRAVLLADRVETANTSRKRRVGLLRHETLPPGEGLWIVPSEGVHTFGMKFTIDVLFLNKHHRVLKVRPNMVRRRISLCLRAHSVLELPAGTAESTGTQAGDQLEISRDG